MQKELAGDLEKIILKCLRKEPSERYQSAADITRYLEGKPIAAEEFISASAATIEIEMPKANSSAAARLKIANSAPSSNGEKSIAVLPFKLIGGSARATGETGDDYLSIGLADTFNKSAMPSLAATPSACVNIAPNAISVISCSGATFAVFAAEFDCIIIYLLNFLRSALFRSLTYNAINLREKLSGNSGLEKISTEWKSGEEIYGDERDVKTDVFIPFISFIPVNFQPLVLLCQIKTLSAKYTKRHESKPRLVSFFVSFRVFSG